MTARLAARVGTGAFSNDGKKFAYRSYDDGGTVSLHLFSAGSDRTLYVQQPMGGHGGPGPSFGPFDQLAFSPDGSLLLDYLLFRPPSGPPNLRVFRADGSILFQVAGAPGGAWTPTGNTLFFFAHNPPGSAGDLMKLDASGQRQVVASGLPFVSWLRMSPDGSGIIYNTSDSSVPDCGGVPHLWRFDLATGRAAQISTAISSGAFFIQPNVVWSDEQKLTACGPGGPTYQDGVILAHDLNTGRDVTVDTTLVVPGIGGPQLPPVTTFYLLDAWFAPA
jgi:Tol biopolymer transport system component